jgi:hypothetical protein
MSIDISWNVSKLDCVPHAEEGDNFVVVAHWQCVGVDEGFSASVYSTCSFEIKQGQVFTAYEDLTLERVLSWIWENGVDKNSAEDAVKQQIENQKNPPIVSPPVPWG